jgi:sec-independent protein translocase protein TatA
MFGIGSMEMVVLFVIALLLFGKRLPEVARSVGKGMTEFKKGLHGIEDEIHTSSTRASSPQSRPLPEDTRDEALAPKFEPPKFEQPE